MERRVPAEGDWIFTGPEAEERKGGDGGEGAPPTGVKSVHVGVLWVKSRVNNHA